MNVCHFFSCGGSPTRRQRLIDRCWTYSYFQFLLHRQSHGCCSLFCTVNFCVGRRYLQDQILTFCFVVPMRGGRYNPYAGTFPHHQRGWLIHSIAHMVTVVCISVFTNAATPLRPKQGTEHPCPRLRTHGAKSMRHPEEGKGFDLTLCSPAFCHLVFKSCVVIYTICMLTIWLEKVLNSRCGILKR